MKKKNSTWNRFNGMHSEGYSESKKQKNFWRPSLPPSSNVENSTEKKVSEKKSNKEPEQLELKF